MSDQGPTFCSTCGSRLASRTIETRQRAYCPSCETPIYRNPNPCAGVLVVDADQLLLIRRTQPPGAGTWSLPAGYLEYDEPPRAGAVRELAEETSVTVSPTELELFDTAFIRPSDQENILVLIYRVERGVTDGDPTPGSDAGAARFWTLPALADAGEEIEPGYEAIFRRALRR